MSKWKVAIGLEIHAQLTCTSKLFSSASTEQYLPNMSVHLFDAAIPGTLPKLNQQSVKQALKAALALNCSVNNTSYFDRKHYFYQDLPLGYQITQQRTPIATNGTLHYFYKDATLEANHETSKSSNKIFYREFKEDSVRIDRIQLEQDSGKSIHDSHVSLSLIDLNRAGVALIEIVFAPELSSPYQAVGVVTTIQELLRHLSLCDGNMEDGSLRVDVNVSVSPIDSSFPFKSNRVEIKNLNSLQRILQASSYEIQRQILLLEQNQIVEQETRTYDVDQRITIRLRSKEVASDYRYFPDPDLPPLYISDEEIRHIRFALPDLPKTIIQRYLRMGLDDEKISLLMSRSELKSYYDQSMFDLLSLYAQNITSKDPMSSLASPRKLDDLLAVVPSDKLHAASVVGFHWIGSELYRYLNDWNYLFSNSPVPTNEMASLVYYLTTGQININQAKMILSRLFYGLKDNTSPTLISSKSIAESLGFLDLVKDSSTSDRSKSESRDARELIRQVCEESINNPMNLNNLEKYRKGQLGLLNFFLGDVMRKTKGKYDATVIRDILNQLLQKK